MTVDEHLTRVVEIEGQIAVLQAEQARHVAAIVEDPCAGAPAPMLEKDYLQEELRVALGESAACSNNRIQLAQMLVHKLPRTLAGMEAGELTLRHASCLANAVLGLPAEDAAIVESECVPFAADHDYSSFTRKVRREVLALDTRTLEQRVADAIEARRVWHYPNPDSATATIGAVLPADGAQTVLAAIDKAAGQSSGEGRERRSRDQRRADGLVQIAQDWLNSLAANGATVGPAVQVVVAASTLLAIDNEPAELDGHGAIPAALAREIAADPNGTWRRLVTDEAGRLIDYGHTRYRPPNRLREFVIARDRECQFPGCHRQGRYCEIDHIEPWSAGGDTNQQNLICLCPRHHHLKHDTTWTIEWVDDGTLRWTSPNGRIYVNDPATYPIDHTADSVVRNDTNCADGEHGKQGPERPPLVA